MQQARQRYRDRFQGAIAGQNFDCAHHLWSQAAVYFLCAAAGMPGQAGAIKRGDKPTFQRVPVAARPAQDFTALSHHGRRLLKASRRAKELALRSRRFAAAARAARPLSGYDVDQANTTWRRLKQGLPDLLPTSEFDHSRFHGLPPPEESLLGMCEKLRRKSSSLTKGAAASWASAWMKATATDKATPPRSSTDG